LTVADQCISLSNKHCIV